MARRGNGEGSITKLKDGRWQARYWVHTAEGSKRRALYAPTRRQAATKLAKAMGDTAQGIVFDDKNLRVDEYLESWIEDAVRGTVRESTYLRDKNLLTNHLCPTIGRVKLKTLNALRIQSLYRDRLDIGLSGSTVQKIHQVFHKALSQAVRWELIPRNPAEMVKPPTASPKEMHPLSESEAKRLLKTARGEKLEALYVLALHTGMRCGELLGLKWEDVDTDNSILRVRRTLTRKDKGALTLGEPKTKSGRRTIRLTPQCVESLRHHRARQAKDKLKAGALYQDQSLVFAGGGGRLINPSNLRQRSFMPLLKSAELPRITFHDLRHTCASLLFQKNVHPKFVQELFGHASVVITLDRYSHMLPSMGGEAAEAMAEALG